MRRFHRVKPPLGSPAADTATARRWRSRQWLPWLALVSYSVLSTLYFHAVWQQPSSKYVGLGGDPQQTIWFLTWIPRSLSHQLNPWLSDYMNYPNGLNVMSNTSMPLSGLVLWPVTSRFGAVVSYNVVMTGALALSAWCAYHLITRLVSNHCAAFVGGLVYGFSPYTIAQSLGHANLVTAFIPPIILLVLHETLVRQRWHWGVAGIALGIATAAQVFLGEELLALTAIAAAVVVVLIAVQFRSKIRGCLPHACKVVALGTAVALALCAWPLTVQFFGPEHPTGPLQTRDIFVTDALNFFMPTGTQLLAPDRALEISSHFTGNASEWNGYIGFPLAALMTYIVISHWRTRWVPTVGLAAIAVALLSMGPHLHVGGHRTPLPLPWAVVGRIPVVGEALPNRLMLFVYLAIGCLLALFLDSMVSTRTWKRAVVAVGATGLGLVPLLPQAALVSDTNIPAFFSHPGDPSSLAPGATLLLPYPSGPISNPILWQAASDLRFKMLGGYWTGPIPEHSAVPHLRDVLTALELSGQAPTLDSTLRTTLRGDMHRANVTTVISGPSLHKAETLAFLAALLGRPPLSMRGVDAWFGLD